MPSKLKTVVIALGGSVVFPKDKLDIEKISEVAGAFKTLAKKGYSLAVVVGGGSIAREYIGAARKIGSTEAECDLLGIDITRVNARLFTYALKEYSAIPEPANSFTTALTAIRPGRVLVMTGTELGQTTDTAAAKLAEYARADLLLIVTAVGGVFEEDPVKVPTARKLAKVPEDSLDEFANVVEQKAGVHQVIDPITTIILRRAKIPTFVIGGDVSEIITAVEEGKHRGTTVSFKARRKPK